MMFGAAYKRRVRAQLFSWSWSFVAREEVVTEERRMTRVVSGCRCQTNESQGFFIITGCLVLLQFSGVTIFIYHTYTLRSLPATAETVPRQNSISDVIKISNRKIDLNEIFNRGSQTTKNRSPLLFQNLEAVSIQQVTSFNASILTEVSITRQWTKTTSTTILTGKPTTSSLNITFTTGIFNRTVTTSILNRTVTTGILNRTVTTGVLSKDASRVQQIYELMKIQLGKQISSPKFVVKARCRDNSTKRRACIDPNCSELSSNVQERVKSLFSEKTVLTKVQDDLLTSIAAQIPENDVILLTAVSSNHFDEMQAMFRTLHAVVYPELAKRENFSMVVWDLGLSATQRKQMEDCCRCQVVTFPFDKFTKRMRDLRCYMWKPLVIRMSQSRARKYAVWQDASIRYSVYPGPVFERGMQHGLQLLRQKGGVSIPSRTLPETFDYYGQKICNFAPFPEIPSGFGIYKNDPFVSTAITNPWARCGFEENCMCPRHSGRSHRCVYGPCHRFDQSALSIITATLYSSDIYRIILFEAEMRQFFGVDRRHIDKEYFNSIECRSKQ